VSIQSVGEGLSGSIAESASAVAQLVTKSASTRTKACRKMYHRPALLSVAHTGLHSCPKATGAFGRIAPIAGGR
jgi:hypothetical protein